MFISDEKKRIDGELFHETLDGTKHDYIQMTHTELLSSSND